MGIVEHWEEILLGVFFFFVFLFLLEGGGELGGRALGWVELGEGAYWEVEH